MIQNKKRKRKTATPNNESNKRPSLPLRDQDTHIEKSLPPLPSLAKNPVGRDTNVIQGHDHMKSPEVLAGFVYDPSLPMTYEYQLMSFQRQKAAEEKQADRNIDSKTPPRVIKQPHPVDHLLPYETTPQSNRQHSPLPPHHSGSSSSHSHSHPLQPSATSFTIAAAHIPPSHSQHQSSIPTITPHDPMLPTFVPMPSHPLTPIGTLGFNFQADGPAMGLPIQQFQLPPHVSEREKEEIMLSWRMQASAALQQKHIEIAQAQSTHHLPPGVTFPQQQQQLLGTITAEGLVEIQQQVEQVMQEAQKNPSILHHPQVQGLLAHYQRIQMDLYQQQHHMQELMIQHMQQPQEVLKQQQPFPLVTPGM